MHDTHIAFVGNPNCGKTTLFNAYTGARLKVANWPGVTVEKKEGQMTYQGHTLRLVDLPGTYSLTCYTMEETLSRQYIMDEEVDVIVDVVDASALERNLYLTLQLIEMGKPVVMALNMMDIVEERGMEIDLHRLPEMLGIPVIPVSARKGTGLDILMHAIDHHRQYRLDPLEKHESRTHHHQHDHTGEFVMVYSDEIEDAIDVLKERLRRAYPDMEKYRWHAIKLLERDSEIMEKYPIETEDVVQEHFESDMIRQKFDYIEEIIHEVLVNKEAKAAKTDRIDHWMTHPVLGLPIFLLIMGLVFFLTFTFGDWLKGYFEQLIDIFSALVGKGLEAVHAGTFIQSLVVDGIIAGVGGILTFLPNIFVLFLALAFLEDSGYMSRVAYVMDGLMGHLGLSGRAFIPMLLGFGCSVPAVMASRVLEDPKDRRRTIFITPFMSCSARLPIYVLFSQIFFGKYAMLAAYSMYLIGLLIGIIIAIIMSRVTHERTSNTLLIELPEYKMPNAHTVAIYVWEKVQDYLSKAGTTIFVASIVLWFLLNFGTSGMVSSMDQSLAASIGRALEPLMRPAGLGYWQIVVALISGIAAKEVVVSSMGVMYGIANIASVSGMVQLHSILAASGFTAIHAYSMMIFCLLYIPCIATIATIRRETLSWKWTLGSVGMQLGVAWLASTVFFQIAGRIAGVL